VKKEIPEKMLAIAGQRAGPNWLTFFEETHGTL